MGPVPTTPHRPDSPGDIGAGDPSQPLNGAALLSRLSTADQPSLPSSPAERPANANRNAVSDSTLGLSTTPSSASPSSSSTNSPSSSAFRLNAVDVIMLMGAAVLLGICIVAMLARFSNRRMQCNANGGDTTVLRKWPRNKQRIDDDEQGEREFPPELMYSTRSIDIARAFKESQSGENGSTLPGYEEVMKAPKAL